MIKRQTFFLLFFSILNLIFITHSGRVLANSSVENNHYKGTILNLSASESVEIEEDLLQASLRFETEGATPQDVQEIVNMSMQSALKEAKNYPNAQVSTENYSVHKSYLRNRKPHNQGAEQKEKNFIWKASQVIRIRSKDSVSVLKLSEQLQSLGFAINNLNYMISPDLREETKDSLMEKAVEKLLHKAKRVANALGKKKVKIININIDSNHGFYPVNNRSMKAMDTEMSVTSAPIAAPGQGRITSSVQASVLISE